MNQYDGSAKQEYDRLVSRHHDDLAKLRAAEARVKELEEDNTRARNLVRQSQEDYDGQRKARKAAEAEVARLRERIEGLKALKEAAETQNFELREEVRRFVEVLFHPQIRDGIDPLTITGKGLLRDIERLLAGYA